MHASFSSILAMILTNPFTKVNPHIIRKLLIAIIRGKIEVWQIQGVVILGQFLVRPVFEPELVQAV